MLFGFMLYLHNTRTNALIWITGGLHLFILPLIVKLINNSDGIKRGECIMYEQFLNQLTMSLSERFSTEEIRIIREKLELVSYDYDITKKETAIEVYNFGIPMLVNVYLICKRTEGLSEATIYNYGTCLRLFFEEIHKAPEQVAANDIRVFLYQYQKRRRVSNRTLDKYRKNIGCFFK